MSELPERSASKILLATDVGDRYVFVAGQRGRLNLPGGGQEEGQSALEALHDELTQELGIDSSAVWNLDQHEQPIKGIVTTAAQERLLVSWTVFTGRLVVPLDSLTIPPDSEITAIEALTPTAALQHTYISALAVRAVAREHPEYLQACL